MSELKSLAASIVKRIRSKFPDDKHAGLNWLPNDTADLIELMLARIAELEAPGDPVFVEKQLFMDSESRIISRPLKVGTKLYPHVQQAVHDDILKNSARWKTIELLMFLGNVELNQDEDGGYSINLDPAENIIAQRWEGNSPEEVIDAAMAAAPSPEGGA